MLSREFVAKLSRDVSVMMEGNEHETFGGLNVVLVGDFHQFPPVVGRQSAPLYWPADSLRDTTDEILGRKIYEQFTVVVRLKEQIRIRDPIWNDVLQHVRYGNCTQFHIDILRSLIITNPNCPETNYEEGPWKNATLITPRHAVRTQWNTAASINDCKKRGKTLFIAPACDTVQNRPVTIAERLAILTQSKPRGKRYEKAGLSNDIELAIGMPVMVTLNLRTELDVANGMRGEIVKIVLDERERVEDNHSSKIRLQYPVRYILVKLHRTKAPQLEGLSENVIPISPISKSFNINVASQRVTVTRTQLPITPAYAFTDYRGQGQTIDPVYIDIGTPPYGHLTPFNLYVALSRGTCREHIRLLRDFDERLVQQHPSEYLRLEDERLQLLNNETKSMFEAGVGWMKK